MFLRKIVRTIWFACKCRWVSAHGGVRVSKAFEASLGAAFDPRTPAWDKEDGGMGLDTDDDLAFNFEGTLSEKPFYLR